MPADPTPLDIILNAMRREFAAGRTSNAVLLAKAAAPYIHPKARGPATESQLSTMRDDQLEYLCKLGDFRACAANENSK